MRHHALDVAVLCACLMLAACGGDKTATPTQQMGEENLPQPNAAGGSVTGMPNPGTPSVLPQPTDDLATDDAAPGLATGDGSEIGQDAPMNPPGIGNTGEMAIPPPQTMPAPTPDPVESGTAPPPQS